MYFTRNRRLLTASIAIKKIDILYGAPFETQMLDHLACVHLADR